MFVSHHTLKWTRTCRSHGRHPHAHTAHFLLNRHTCNLVLVAVSGLATLVVWFSVCVCHIRFRREWARDGHSADELDYRAPGFPVLPWLAIVMCIGALVLVVLDETQRSTLIA